VAAQEVDPDNGTLDCHVIAYPFGTTVSFYFPLLCRPIAIQEVLRESGLALWLDLDYRLTFSDLSSWIDRQALHQIYRWEPDPDWIRSVDPDPEGQKWWTTKIEKVKKFHVLKFWMFSFEGWRVLLSLGRPL
jgi:hypothetical protein